MRWTEEIDRVTAECEARFGTLSASELNWKPEPDRWSIAQNLDHLIVLNDSYVPILNALRDGEYRPPFHARVGFLASLFGRMLLKAVAPERTRKTKTFEVWEPAESEIKADIVDRFRRHQEGLKERVRSVAEPIERGAVIHSPASRAIVYRLGTAFDIMVAHEKRHLNQARKVLELLEARDGGG